MITYKEKFYKIVTEAREYYKMVNKIEDALGGIIIDALQDFPNTILTILEKESNREWTDNIWEQLYNYELKDDLGFLLQDIMKLPEEE